MRKITLLICFLFLYAIDGFGQCITTSYYTSATSTNSGLQQILNSYGYTNEYITVNGLLVGEDYTFTCVQTSTSVAKYITITDANDTVIAFGPSPLLVTEISAASVRMHYTDDDTCAGGTASAHVLTAQLMLTCPTPTGQSFSDVTLEGATFIWNAGGSETEWEILILPSADPAPTSSDSGTPVTGSSEYIETGLSSSTAYKFYVRANCGSEFSPWTNGLGFTTACEAFDSFTNGFEGLVTGTVMPDCWSKKIVATSGSGSYVYVSASDVNTGTRALRLGNSGDAAAKLYAITPMLNDLPLGTHRMKFFAKGATVSLEVGTMTDPTDETTFTSLQTFALTASHQAYSVNFDAPTTDSYVAFKASYTSTYYYASIDDLSWEVLPTCPDLSGLIYSNVTDSTVDLEWTPGGSETAWQYALGSATDTDPEVLASFDVTGTPETTVTNLDPNTVYRIWVRAKCSANDFGAWTSFITFKTQCVAISDLPWEEGFEDVATVGSTAFPDCWKKENGDWATATAVTYNTPRSGTKYLRDSYSATNEYIWTPGFNLTAGVNYDFSFFAQGDGYTGWVVDVFANTTPSSTGATQVGDTYNVPGLGAIAMQQYNEVTRTFTPATSGVYYFALRVNQPDGSVSWYLAFDDFKLDLTPACSSPTGLQVIAANTTATSASVSWTASVTNPANGYQYIVSDNNDAPQPGDQPTGSVGAGITTANFTDLNGATTYYVWVRSACSGNEFSAWTSSVNFITPCEPEEVMDVVQDFEGTTENTLPGCWVGKLISGSNNWKGFTPDPTAGDIRVTASGTRIAYKDYNNSVAHLYSLPMDYSSVSQATQVSVSLHRHASAAAADKYTIYANTSPSLDGATQLLEVFSKTTVEPTVAETGFYNYIAEIPSSFNGQDQVYVIIVGYTNNGFASYALGVDDFKVEYALGTPSHDLNRLKVYPNPVSDVLNLSFDQNISSVDVYNLVGQKMIAKTIDATNASLDMSKLSAGTYLVKIMANDSVKTIKVIKK